MSPWSLIVGLSVACLGLAWEYARRSVASSKARHERASTRMLRATVGTTGLTLLALATEWWRRHSFPLETLSDALLWFSLTPLIATTAVYALSRSAWPALLLLPLAALAQTSSLFVRDWLSDEAARQTLGSALLAAHVGLFLTGYCALIVCGGLALVYLVLDRQLKKRGLASSWEEGVPPLGRLDRSLAVTGAIAVILWGLAIALAMALLLRASAPPSESNLRTLLVTDFTVLSSLAVWIYFVIFLVFRQRLGWVGRRAAMIVLMGVALLLTSYGAAKLQKGGGFHGFSAERADQREASP